MAQQQWTVPGYGGIPYKVGLYHGERTGHLLVHCNNKIMIIDFGVKEDKHFSFMLGEELYELDIVKKPQGYEYIFKHNEDIATPHNVRRKESNETDRKRLWLAAGVIVAVIFCIIGISRYWHGLADNVRQRLAQGEGTYTTAILLEQGTGQWFISYQIAEETVKLQLRAEELKSSFGFPIKMGDVYQVRIDPKYKYVYWIDWNRPNQATQAQLHQLCMEKQYQLNPSKAEQELACELEQAYQIKGLAGWAMFYNQNISAEDQAFYNEESHDALIRRGAFKKGVRACLAKQ